MSSLRIMGREPRGARDAATLASLSKLNSELVQSSQLSSLVSTQFMNLDVVKTSEYNTFAAPFATTTDVNKEFQQYVERNDQNLVYLNNQGYIPRATFERFVVTRPTVVTAAPAIGSQPYIKNGESRALQTLTLPALPYETIPLVFGSFRVFRYADPADVTIFANIGEGANASTISSGANVRVPKAASLKSAFYVINITPENINSARLQPGVSHNVFLSMSVGAGANSQEGFQSTQEPSSLEALFGWSVIQIPGGRD